MASPRVVVIDDERHMRELLELGLGEDGFDVKSAPDGRTGLQLVRDWRPDAIVLDVMMPFVDGLELLPMLRRITEAPILMLSAKADTDDRISGLRRGADDYIPKPFEMSELAARLHSALRRPRLEQPAIVAYADLTIDLDRRDVKRGDHRIELSAREYALLLTFVRNPGARVHARSAARPRVGHRPRRWTRRGGDVRLVSARKDRRGLRTEAHPHDTRRGLRAAGALT